MDGRKWQKKKTIKGKKSKTEKPSEISNKMLFI